MQVLSIVSVWIHYNACYGASLWPPSDLNIGDTLTEFTLWKHGRRVLIICLPSLLCENIGGFWLSCWSLDYYACHYSFQLPSRPIVWFWLFQLRAIKIWYSFFFLAQTPGALAIHYNRENDPVYRKTRPKNHTTRNPDNLTTPEAWNNNTTKETTTSPTAGHIFDDSTLRMQQMHLSCNLSRLLLLLDVKIWYSFQLPSRPIVWFWLFQLRSIKIWYNFMIKLSSTVSQGKSTICKWSA
jgi:hypothetical protein